MFNKATNQTNQLTSVPTKNSSSRIQWCYHETHSIAKGPPGRQRVSIPPSSVPSSWGSLIQLLCHQEGSSAAQFYLSVWECRHSCLSRRRELHENLCTSFVFAKKDNIQNFVTTHPIYFNVFRRITIFIITCSNVLTGLFNVLSQAAKVDVTLYWWFSLYDHHHQIR